MKETWKHIPSEPKKIRDFGILMFVVAGAIVPLFLAWRQDWVFELRELLFFSGGTVFMMVCWLLPDLLRPVYKAWMLLAIGLGFIMTRVIIMLVFLLIMTPIGLVRRGIGRPLYRTFRIFREPEKESYWIRRSGRNDPATSENQF